METLTEQKKEEKLLPYEGSESLPRGTVKISFRNGRYVKTNDWSKLCEIKKNEKSEFDELLEKNGGVEKIVTVNKGDPRYFMHENELLMVYHDGKNIKRRLVKTFKKGKREDMELRKKLKSWGIPGA